MATFLRATTREKDAKVHRYWSIVENRRLSGGRVSQRHVLYLGEINSSQERAWRKSIEVFDERSGQSSLLSLFPEDRIDDAPAGTVSGHERRGVSVRTATPPRQAVQAGNPRPSFVSIVAVNWA